MTVREERLIKRAKKLHEERFFNGLIDRNDREKGNKIIANLLEEYEEGVVALDMNEKIDALVDTVIFANNSVLDLDDGDTMFREIDGTVVDCMLEYLRGQSDILTAVASIKLKSVRELAKIGNPIEFLEIGYDYISQRRQDPKQAKKGREIGEKWQKDRTQVLAEPVYIKD